MKRSLLIVLVTVLCTAFALVALAAPKKKGADAPAKTREKSSRSHRAKGSKNDKGDKKVAADAGAPSTATRAREVADAGAPSSGVKESKQTDAGSSYKFGELEIEGRLKTPQIVYFLRRVRAEFAAQDLGHRSFQGELGETRKEPSF